MSKKPITALISVWGGNGPIEMIEKSHFDQMEDKLKGWQESQQYRYIGRDGKPVLARDLEARIEQLERELCLERQNCEQAWRRAQVAEAKVKGWESQVYMEAIPMFSIPVDGFGPASGEQVSVPKVERITELLGKLAAEKALADGLHDDLKAAYIHDMPDEAEEPASLFDYRKARGL